MAQEKALAFYFSCCNILLISNKFTEFVEQSFEVVEIHRKHIPIQYEIFDQSNGPEISVFGLSLNICKIQFAKIFFRLDRIFTNYII